MAQFEWLADIVPCFNINGADVEILNTPEEFYIRLKELAKTAERKIVLSSLYLGTGKMELDLIDDVKNNCLNNPNLVIKVLLDFSRATRGQKNSCTTLKPLLDITQNLDDDHDKIIQGQVEGPLNRQRVQVYLFHSPLLRGLYKKLLPQRWNEILGVQHMKLYIFDDNLIISGANLSHDYFTYRQDRYILIKNCRKLNEFYEEIIDAVGSCSFRLNKDGCHTNLHENCNEHPFLGNFEEFCLSLKSKLLKVVQKWRQELKQNVEDRVLDTSVYPLLQMGAAGLTTEDDVITDILKGTHLKPNCLISVASGYFNLTADYIDLIQHSKHKFSILMASPQANGFQGAQGISSYVPSVYTDIEKQFFDRIINLGLQEQIKLYEYRRPGWTFHAKGIWISEQKKNFTLATMIGSTNYGYRSVYRDLETQIVLVTKNKILSEKLEKEKEFLWNDASVVDAKCFQQKDHQVPLWLRFFTRFIRHFF